MSVPFYPFHTLSFKLSNKEINFTLPQLRLSNIGNRKILKKRIRSIPLTAQTSVLQVFNSNRNKYILSKVGFNF